jgi:hypothetical protein
MKRTFKAGLRKYIHETGAKGERDRDTCSMDYERLCSYFHVRRMRDAEIAKLTNAQFYAACEDIFKRQSPKRQRKYAEAIYGADHVEYRLRPWAFKWYYTDLMRFGGGSWIVRTILSPLTYVRFLARRKARLAKAEATNETAVD